MVCRLTFKFFIMLVSNDKRYYFFFYLIPVFDTYKYLYLLLFENFRRAVLNCNEDTININRNTTKKTFEFLLFINCTKRAKIFF